MNPARTATLDAHGENSRSAHSSSDWVARDWATIGKGRSVEQRAPVMNYTTYPSAPTNGGGHHQHL